MIRWLPPRPSLKSCSPWVGRPSGVFLAPKAQPADSKNDPLSMLLLLSSEPPEVKCNEPRLWNCHKCTATDLTPKELRRHVRDHHWIRCLECAQACKDADALADHYLTMHSMSGKYCQDCKKYYKTRRKLTLHRRRCHGTKYVCKLCNHRARSRYRLDIHMRKHSGLKPLSCPHCKRGYADPCNLKR